MTYATLILSLALGLQEKKELFVVDEEHGFQLFRPKDEKWAVTKGGEGALLYKDSHGVVRHRIDELQVEVLVQVLQNPEKEKFAEFEEIVSGMIKGFEQDQDKKPIPDRKVKKRKSEKGKFPGAKGPNGWYSDIEIQDKGETVRVIRHWMFIDKMNSTHMVRISIIGHDEIYKKCEKEVQYVLASFQTFRVKRK